MKSLHFFIFILCLFAFSSVSFAAGMLGKMRQRLCKRKAATHCRKSKHKQRCINHYLRKKCKLLPSKRKTSSKKKKKGGDSSRKNLWEQCRKKAKKRCRSNRKCRFFANRTCDRKFGRKRKSFLRSGKVSRRRESKLSKQVKAFCRKEVDRICSRKSRKCRGLRYLSCVRKKTRELKAATR